MKRERLKETSIAELNELYQFDWNTNDFLVSDEQNLILSDTSKAPKHIDGFIIGICSCGTTKFEVNLKVYEGSEHSMIITTPQQIIRVMETSADFKCRFIIFSKRFLTASYINPHVLDTFQFADVNAAPVLHLKPYDAGKLKELFAYIWKRFQEVDNPFRKEITGNLLMALLHDFEAIYQKQFKVEEKKLNRKQELSSRFHHLLFKHFRQERSVQFYAEKLFVTPKYLSQTVKELTGKSASEWIDAAVALEAQALLRSSGRTIQQIALSLHFPDQSSFGKFFKREVGLSPSLYRQGNID